MNRVLGLFPERLDLTPVYSILEIGSGTGEWTLEAVRYFPVRYVGIESSPPQVAYAQAMTKAVGYDDLVCFEQGELTEPLPFATGSFDLVHVRFLTGSLPTLQWSVLLQEVWRVLTSGGVVLLSEAEWPITNSSTAQQFADLVTHAMWKAGYGLSTDGCSLGIASGLPKLLQQCGWHTREHSTHLLPFSYGLPLHQEMTTFLWTTAHLMQPFLMRMGYGSQHELEALSEEMAQESHDMDFVGTMTVLQTWSQKDGATEAAPCSR